MADDEIALRGKRIAILLTDAFEQVEMTEPRRALDAAGAKTQLVSPNKDKVQGWHHQDKADFFPVDVPLDQAKPEDFDALLLPGGTINADHLRKTPRAVELVRAFARAGKPIAAICHGPWMLVEADVVRGKRMTSTASIKTDLKNAGAQWVDEEVVVDGGIVTSRRPADIPAFSRRAIELFSRGVSRPAQTETRA
jgi:protease I